MHHSEITTLSIRDLIPHPSNPRKISLESLNRLCDSIRANGYWEHRPFQFPFPAENKERHAHQSAPLRPNT